MSNPIDLDKEEETVIHSCTPHAVEGISVGTAQRFPLEIRLFWLLSREMLGLGLLFPLLPAPLRFSRHCRRP